MTNNWITWNGIPGVYIGWQAFGTAHIVALFLSLIFCILLSKFGSLRTFRILGIAGLLIYVLRLIHAMLVGSSAWGIIQSVFPLYSCDLSLLLLSIGWSFGFVKQLKFIVFWSFLPILFVLLFPELSAIENILTYKFLDFWLGHILAVALAIGSIKFYSVRLRDYYKAVLAFILLLTIAGLINSNTGSNYMFLLTKPKALSSWNFGYWNTFPQSLVIWIIIIGVGFYVQCWVIMFCQKIIKYK